MKRKTTHSQKKLDQQAAQIASEIFNLVNQYTNDSAVSKFFLQEEISQSLYISAGGLASVIYEPQLEPDDIKDARVLSLFLVLMTYGFQIYIKERSLRTNAAPYKLPTDIQFIQSANQLVLTKSLEGNVLSTPLADAIIAIILKQIRKNIEVKHYEQTSYLLNATKLYEYMTVALYFGYNFASLLINKKT
jgi:hypothetical protein